MQNEYQILNNIVNNKNSTQRDIAKSTGLSLGAVNVLIKRLVKKGFLKVERVNKRTIQYILTPSGLREKTEATYRYILTSYRLINRVEEKVNNLLSSRIDKQANKVLFFGTQDEISDMMMDKLRGLNAQITLIKTINEIVNETSGNRDTGAVIVVWQPDYAETLSSYDFNYINLLEEIN